MAKKVARKDFFYNSYICSSQQRNFSRLLQIFVANLVIFWCNYDKCVFCGPSFSRIFAVTFRPVEHIRKNHHVQLFKAPREKYFYLLFFSPILNNTEKINLSARVTNNGHCDVNSCMLSSPSVATNPTSIKSHPNNPKPSPYLSEIGEVRLRSCVSCCEMAAAAAVLTVGLKHLNQTDGAEMDCCFI